MYVLESASLGIEGEPVWSPDLAGASMATCFGCSEAGEAVADAVSGAQGCDRLYRVVKYVRVDSPASVGIALDLAAETAVRMTTGLCEFSEAVRIGNAIRRLKVEPTEAEDEALEHSADVLIAEGELAGLALANQLLRSLDLMSAKQEIRSAIGKRRTLLGRNESGATA